MKVGARFTVMLLEADCELPNPFVAVTRYVNGPVAVGAHGEHRVREGVVLGEDPLAPFGPEAPGFVLRAATMVGAQAIGKTYVAEAKSAIETTTADVKALAAVKTPSAFFKLQGEILRRNFDDALALGSKNTKAVFKLANDSIAPISGRVGKSSVTVNLAAAMAQQGLRVGVVDADVYGYSIPRMLGVNAKPEVNGERKILPLDAPLRESGDAGRPVVLADPEGNEFCVLRSLAEGHFTL
mgnify:CR=1 FL=1